MRLPKRADQNTVFCTDIIDYEQVEEVQDGIFGNKNGTDA